MRHIDIGQRAQGAHERGGRLSGNAHNNAHTDVVQVKLVEEEQRILNAYGVEEAVECDELRGLETVDKQLNAVDGTLPARERRHTDGVGKRHQRGLAARLAAEGALDSMGKSAQTVGAHDGRHRAIDADGPDAEIVRVGRHRFDLSLQGVQIALTRPSIARENMPEDAGGALGHKRNVDTDDRTRRFAGDRFAWGVRFLLGHGIPTFRFPGPANHCRTATDRSTSTIRQARFNALTRDG